MQRVFQTHENIICISLPWYFTVINFFIVSDLLCLVALLFNCIHDAVSEMYKLFDSTDVVHFSLLSTDFFSISNEKIAFVMIMKWYMMCWVVRVG